MQPGLRNPMLSLSAACRGEEVVQGRWAGPVVSMEGAGDGQGGLFDCIAPTMHLI